MWSHYFNTSFGNSVANPRTDGRMDRKFSHFHISRLLVLFLKDIASILPVLPDWELTWTAGEISKALWALSSNLLFSQGLSVPQDGRINPRVRSTWLTISMGLAGEMPVCLHCLGRSLGPCSSGPLTQARGLQHIVTTHVVLTFRARLPQVGGPRGGRARPPWCHPLLCWASVSWGVSPWCSWRAPAPWGDEATYLFPSPAQPWGWYALACILCFPEIQWSWTTFKLCQEVTTILHLSPGLWLQLTYHVCCHFSPMYSWHEIFSHDSICWLDVTASFKYFLEQLWSMDVQTN